MGTEGRTQEGKMYRTWMMDMIKATREQQMDIKLSCQKQMEHTNRVNKTKAFREGMSYVGVHLHMICRFQNALSYVIWWRSIDQRMIIWVMNGERKRSNPR